MADFAAAANAIATAIRGIAPPPPAAAPQSVSLTPFTGAVRAVTEDSYSASNWNLPSPLHKYQMLNKLDFYNFICKAVLKTIFWNYQLPAKTHLIMRYYH